MDPVDRRHFEQVKINCIAHRIFSDIYMISSWLFLAGLVLQLQFWWSCSTIFITLVCGFYFSCVSGFSLGRELKDGGQMGQPEIHRGENCGGPSVL